METCFFCLLDVLGFSNKLEDIGLSEMNRLYQKLADRVNGVSGVIALVPDVSGHLGVCSRDFESHYFSDTVIVWTKALGNPTARIFTELVGELICDGIEIGLPLRGTITKGEIIADKATNTYLGLLIVEAATTERMQEWIGVSFGSSVSAHEAPLHADTILPFKSHYKDAALADEGKRRFCTSIVVDWPRQWRLGERKEDPRRLVESMNQSTNFSSYYENALKFIDFSENNHDWFRQQQYKDGERLKAG